MRRLNLVYKPALVSFFTIVTAGFALALLSGAGCRSHAPGLNLPRVSPPRSQKGQSAVSDKAPPTVRLTLGEDFETVQRHSTLRLLTTRDYLLETDELGSSSAVVFAYMRAGGAFTLPPALRLGCGFTDGHVVDVGVSPHLHFLSQAEAIALVAHLSQIIGKAGWKTDEERLTPDQANQAFADPKTDAQRTLELHSWRCQDDEMHLKMERYQKQGERLPSGDIADRDKFTVTLDIENPALLKRYSAENDQKRSLKRYEPGEMRHIPVRVEPAGS